MKQSYIKKYKRNLYQRFVKSIFINSFKLKIERKLKENESIIYTCKPNNPNYIRRFFLSMPRNEKYKFIRENKNVYLQVYINNKFQTFYKWTILS